MSAATESPNKWRKRLLRFTITSTLMGVSFAVGVAITLIIAVRLLAPIAVTGMTLGMVGLASESVNATTSALYSGDSEMRLTVLTQLKQSFGTQPTQKFDTATANWILPAIKQCQTDADPVVVAIADELVAFINDNTLPSPQSAAEYQKDAAELP